MKKFIVVCISAFGLAGCSNEVKSFDDGFRVHTLIVRDSSEPCEINFYLSAGDSAGKSKSYRARLLTKECQK